VAVTTQSPNDYPLPKLKLNLEVKCNKTVNKKTVIEQASCLKPARKPQKLSKKSAGRGI